MYVFSLQSSVHVLVCSGLWALLLRGDLSSCPGFVLGVGWFWGGSNYLLPGNIYYPGPLKVYPGDLKCLRIRIGFWVRMLVIMSLYSGEYTIPRMYEVLYKCLDASDSGMFKGLCQDIRSLPPSHWRHSHAS